MSPARRIRARRSPARMSPTRRSRARRRVRRSPRSRSPPRRRRSPRRRTRRRGSLASGSRTTLRIGERRVRGQAGPTPRETLPRTSGGRSASPRKAVRTRLANGPRVSRTTRDLAWRILAPSMMAAKRIESPSGSRRSGRAPGNPRTRRPRRPSTGRLRTRDLRTWTRRCGRARAVRTLAGTVRSAPTRALTVPPSRRRAAHVNVRQQGTPMRRTPIRRPRPRATAPTVPRRPESGWIPPPVSGSARWTSARCRSCGVAATGSRSGSAGTRPGTVKVVAIGRRRQSTTPMARPRIRPGPRAGAHSATTCVHAMTGHAMATPTHRMVISGATATGAGLGASRSRRGTSHATWQTGTRTAPGR